MVVEFLTFEVDPSEREQWLRVEEETWSRFLEQQPGFVSKQMWVEREQPGTVHAIICWEDQASWDAVPADGQAAVDASMDTWMREARSCRVFDVVRDS